MSTPRSPRWSLRATAALALALAVVGCAPSTDTVGTSSATSTTAVPEAAHGVVDVFTPETSSGTAPLVVLVPGGGWVTADPSGMIPLAEFLADHGAVVATTTYRTAGEATYFPIPAEDVACAVAEAVAEATARGFTPDSVTIVGHSAGAPLAALVALEPETFGGACPDPMARPDRFVGLAGPYDVVRASDVAANLFGPDAPDPAMWTEGDPTAAASERPELDVLLIHGTGDRTVPIDFTRSFAAALVAGGHDVETFYPEGVDHLAVFTAEVSGPLIAGWLDL